MMASLTFIRYQVTDTGWTLTFNHPDPGAGKASEYTVEVTEAELAAATTPLQRRALLETKLRREFRQDSGSTTLDGLIGQVIMI